MKHRILLPTDFSKNALHAIKYAMELFRSDHCEFYLLNVFSASGNLMQSLMNMEPGSELYERAKAESETGLAKVMDMLVISKERYPNHHFHTLTMFNSIVEGINVLVNDKAIDLVVMGTKGQTASRTMVYGSTAVNVMEKVRQCPILVVPERAKPILPKEIVFPTNYKNAFKKSELQYLIDIAKKTKATIQVLYINEGNLSELQLENKALLKNHFSEVKFVFRELSHMHVPTAINCFVESRESDMVAFVNKKHLFFGSILTQALVKEIGYDSRVPILVMHN